jgi:hypothetical protein
MPSNDPSRTPTILPTVAAGFGQSSIPPVLASIEAEAKKEVSIIEQVKQKQREVRKQRAITSAVADAQARTKAEMDKQLEVKLRNEQLIEKAAESTSAWQAKFGATLLKAKARLERSKWAVKEKQAEAASAEHATKEVENRFHDMDDEERNTPTTSGAIRARGGRVNQCVSCRDTTTFLKKHDYQGSDLIRGGVRASSPAECCKKCRQNRRCRFWTYGTHNPRKGRCWLKKNSRGSQRQNNRESGRVCHKKNKRRG